MNPPLVLGERVWSPGFRGFRRAHFRTIPHRCVLSRSRVCIPTRPFSRSIPNGSHYLVHQCIPGRHRSQCGAQFLWYCHRGGCCRWTKFDSRGCVPELCIVRHPAGRHLWSQYTEAAGDKECSRSRECDGPCWRVQAMKTDSNECFVLDSNPLFVREKLYEYSAFN